MSSLLIVDDEPRMRSLVWSIVGDLFDSVRECEDGADAQSAYAEQRPDWVLMDVAMPRLNGIAATQRIRANDPKARIVIVTGFSNEATRAAALNAGACAYVSKENLFELREILGLAAEPLVAGNGAAA
jgi:two-component system NarL family response regulator